MDATSKVLAIFTGLVVVATIAVIIGKNSQAAAVISAFTKGFGQDLQAAVSPVTGSQATLA